VKTLALRWLKFNFVGGLGIVMQLAALEALIRLFHVGYLLATAVAVELAVLHNFVWHERFTWKDRAGGPVLAVAGRLARFHAGNGLVSIAGNLILMRLFVGTMQIRPFAANAMAIAICSFLNFAAVEWFVFRKRIS
jgi:putative flippase GtrA